MSFLLKSVLGCVGALGGAAAVGISSNDWGGEEVERILQLERISGLTRELILAQMNMATRKYKLMTSVYTCIENLMAALFNCLETVNVRTGGANGR